MKLLQKFYLWIRAIRRGHWVLIPGRTISWIDIKCLTYGTDPYPRRLNGLLTKVVICPVCGKLVGLPKGSFGKWVRESGEIFH